MKEKLERFIKVVFSLFILIAILGGGVAFVLFLVALIIGGSTGEALAVNTFEVVIPIFIRFATIAVAAGLIHYYVIGEHALTMNEDQ